MLIYIYPTETCLWNSFSTELNAIFHIYVSESDIVGPNGNLSDIKNLVPFEMELFEDSSYKFI